MSNADNQVFFYVDGIPTKGLWLDMDLIDSWDEVKTALVCHALIDEDYGGDILAADAEGLCRPFLSRYGSFDLGEFVECRDADGEEGAKLAYLGNWHQWDTQHFEGAYVADYTHADDPKLAFVEDLVDETGLLEDMPEHLRGYFDYEAYARDLFLGDHTEVDGYIFADN